ncbi:MULTISPECIES: DUF1707 domain-containing protein [Actinomadura]|uniref:DUF1707 domain-containing protein n=1 Tax=Actinomadura litoris TaxID=2678616 RepID=A0A7K1KWI8_9ACTN|nr:MULTISPECIES: DUF1707 domain-containing protein [Actinomadura]MBT2211399.1 DUF1707 domain-containing protein [Actinomadura sp. NEAU-AAG7]MUN36316.1 DUF1707 domain-containing protein [Actinomadura litoris]
MSQSSPQPGRPPERRPADLRKEPRPAAVPETAGGPGVDPAAVPGVGVVRASDAEREAVVERLRVASVEGRLTFEELTERSEAAYAAVTRGDLELITRDLPGMGAPGANPAPVQVKRKFSAIMGDCKERIVGRIDERLEAVSVMGDVELDLRGAQVPTGEVTVYATAVMGDIKIIVPDGVTVELSGRAVMGDRRVAVREPRPGARVPVVHVVAHAIMGDVKIVDDEHHAPLRRAIASWWKDRST